MKATIKTINSLAQRFKDLQPLKPTDQQRLDKKIRLEFNFNSNHIEGNTLTYNETELLLIFDKTTGNHELREYEEMKSHDVAFELVKDWTSDRERPLSEMALKNLHEVLLVRPFWKEAMTPDGQPTRRLIKVGTYKEYPNSVRLQNGEMFHYASPEETPILTGELIQWYRAEEEKYEMHPVELAALLHYKFVRIHPFDDGNGRISRLLINYVLFKHNLPPVIIKSADKKNYLFALNQADVGNFEAFVNYIAEQLVWSLELSIKAAQGESLEETEDYIKEIVLLKRRLSTDNTMSKHPAIIYKTFNWFNKNIWSAIKEVLSQFDGLFGESKEFRLVNSMSETFQKINIFEPQFLKTTTPEKLKIFGFDIYDTDINTIKWKQVKYGLKGAKGKPDVEIKAELDFRVDRYYMHFQIDYTDVESFERNYGDNIFESDIEKLKAKFSKMLLEAVKERTDK